MYSIFKTNTESGETHVKDLETLTEVKMYFNEVCEGHKPYDGTNDNDKIFRLDAYEVLPNGDLDLVESTGDYWA